jgi:hypothetical protein
MQAGNVNYNRINHLNAKDEKGNTAFSGYKPMQTPGVFQPVLPEQGDIPSCFFRGLWMQQAL